jgi:hypothetical protein
MSNASLPEPRPAANQEKLPAIDKPDGKHWAWWMAVPLAMGLVILCALYFRRATLPPRIAIGQELSIARAVAESRGYELQDASQLALDPMPDAFYLVLPADRGPSFTGHRRPTLSKRSILSTAGTAEGHTHTVPTVECPHCVIKFDARAEI